MEPGKINPSDLDKHITGNYGENQYVESDKSPASIEFEYDQGMDIVEITFDVNGGEYQSKMVVICDEPIRKVTVLNSHNQNRNQAPTGKPDGEQPPAF